MSLQKESPKKVQNLQMESEKNELEKKIFFANIKHEFNPHLKAIGAMVDLLLETSLKEQQEKYIITIQSAIQSLQFFAENLSKKKKLEPAFIKFNVKDFMEEIIHMFSMNAKERLSQLNYKIHDNTPSYIISDPDYIRQALIHLIDNALKNTVKGQISISISVNEENELIINITDTGLGINKNKLKDILSQKVFSSKPTGLTIVKYIAEIMNGEILIESEVGKGTNITFKTKLNSEESINQKDNEKSENDEIAGIEKNKIIEDEAKEAEVQTEDVKENEAKEDEVKILAAEDNPINQKINQKVFEKIGYKIKMVSNGQEAVDELKRTSYDIVFMDIQMPVLDGREATKIIRDPNSGVLNNSIPVIAMTAHTTTEIRKELLASGLNEIAHKPINANVVGDLIKKFIFENHKENIDNQMDEKETQPIDEEYIFNKNELLERLGGDIDLYNEIINDFFVDVSELIEKLKTALKAKDARLITEFGFSLKEAATDISAVSFREAAHKIESSCKEGDLSQAECLVNKLLMSYNKLTQLINSPSETSKEKISQNTSKDTSQDKIETQSEDENIPDKIFDKNELLERMGGDEIVYKKTIELFLKFYPQLNQALKNSLDSNDPEAIRNDAHSIKGAAANIAAPKLSETAKIIEYAGRDGKCEKAKQYFNNLENAYEELKLSLQSEL